MYNEINRELEDAYQGILQFKRISSKLGELTRQKDELTEKVSKLQSILEKEDIDVEKLEGKSMTHIFHSILGNLEEQMEKERQEALAAKLKYDQAVQELDHICQEIEKLKSERDQYKACESTYTRLYTKKKELLLQSDSEAAEKILSLAEQISFLNNQQNEIEEARNAGTEVLQHLNNASNSLDSAEGWGTFDILGGGLISDIAKHSRIDDAKSEAEQSQIALSKFRTELADVKITSQISIETDGFAKFADFFFDGLIADWCMQSRIHDSQESVENTKNEVGMVLSKLNNMKIEEASRVEALEKELSALVINAQDEKPL